MRRIDLFDEIKRDAELIIATYMIQLDLNDDDAVYDWVSLDMNDSMLDYEHKQTLTLYNYFLQLKAFSVEETNIILEYGTP